MKRDDITGFSLYFSRYVVEFVYIYKKLDSITLSKQERTLWTLR